MGYTSLETGFPSRIKPCWLNQALSLDSRLSLICPLSGVFFWAPFRDESWPFSMTVAACGGIFEQLLTILTTSTEFDPSPVERRYVSRHAFFSSFDSVDLLAEKF